MNPIKVLSSNMGQTSDIRQPAKLPPKRRIIAQMSIWLLVVGSCDVCKSHASYAAHSIIYLTGATLSALHILWNY